MRFFVSHETVYRYAKPVRLTPHRLRLNPRIAGAALIARELIIEPTPSLRVEHSDAFSNAVTHLEFDRHCQTFRILSRFELDIAPPRHQATAGPSLPLAAEPEFAPYLAHDETDAKTRDFAERIADASGGSALEFLARLNATLYADFGHVLRLTGAARAPAETLDLGEGACRDLTTLFLAACRILGLPARFVSGYQARAETPDGRRHLHAWAEAYLPGLGWRGYDPTHGLEVTDGHVALAAAPTQAPTMPIDGGYWGEFVESKLSYDVQVETR